MILRSEESADISKIRRVNKEAFETKTEADLVDALREDGAVVISLVAIDEGEIIGHILFTNVSLEGFDIPIIGIGPMAVLPEHQRKGIGTQLMKAGLEECKSKDYEAVVVLGYPDYYTRFGFSPSIEYGIKSEYDVPPEVFMIKELKKGALVGKSGTMKYHRLFSEFE